MDSCRVELTPAEIRSAAMAGVERRLERMADGRRDAFGAAPGQEWQMDIEGALAECALAKWLGVYWCGTGVRSGVDVGGMVDVRATSRADGCLLLHPGDDDERPVFLLTGSKGIYRVRGWLLAGDGKAEAWWRETSRPAYFVPQNALYSPQEWQSRPKPVDPCAQAQ